MLIGHLPKESEAPRWATDHSFPHQLWRDMSSFRPVFTERQKSHIPDQVGQGEELEAVCTKAAGLRFITVKLAVLKTKFGCIPLHLVGLTNQSLSLSDVKFLCTFLDVLG
jgi:hypothetical protein